MQCRVQLQINCTLVDQSESSNSALHMINSIINDCERWPLKIQSKVTKRCDSCIRDKSDRKGKEPKNQKTISTSYVVV